MHIMAPSKVTKSKRLKEKDRANLKTALETSMPSILPATTEIPPSIEKIFPQGDLQIKIATTCIDTNTTDTICFLVDSHVLYVA